MSLFVTLHMFIISACCIAFSVPHIIIIQVTSSQALQLSLRVIFQNLISNELPSEICRTLNVPQIGVVPCNCSFFLEL